MLNSPSQEWLSVFLSTIVNPHGATAITAHSDTYEVARRVFNKVHDRRPAVLLRDFTPDIVARTLDFAAAHCIPLAIRGGGHHIAGFSTCDDGIVLDFSEDREACILSDGNTLSAAPGARLRDVDATTLKAGRILPTGTVSDTGIGGLALGGGIGWLLGTHGLTCDRIVGVDMVTADGKIRHINDETDQDLMWALRGGGGNFGVVTRFHFETSKFSPMISGQLTLSRKPILDALIDILEWLRVACPRELTVAPSIQKSTGQPAVLNIEFCLQGTDRGLIDTLHQLAGTSNETLFVNKDFAKWQQFNDGTFTEHLCGYWKAQYTQKVTEEALSQLLFFLENAPGKQTSVTFEHLHGAFEERELAHSSFPLFGRQFGILISSRWERQEDLPLNKAWVNNCWQADATDLSTYSNYAGEDTPVFSTIRSDFQDRLLTIKRKHDPHNLFRLNHNINKSLNGDER